MYELLSEAEVEKVKYLILSEEELEEYTIEYRQQLAMTAYIVPKVAENKKYYNVWKKAYRTRDIAAAASFCSGILDKIFKGIRAEFGSDIGDIHDMLFDALLHHKKEYEPLLRILDTNIEKHKDSKGFKKPEGSITSRIKKALTRST